jgi:hypothetical protein
VITPRGALINALTPGGHYARLSGGEFRVFSLITDTGLWLFPMAVRLRQGHRSSLKKGQEKGERKMLWTIFVILLVMWVLGIVTSYTLGGFIHILLLFAVVVLVFQLISGRRVV